MLKSQGFTLIELLLAIAIAAMVVTVVNTTFFESHRLVEQVTDQTRTYQMARIALDRMVKDLNCAYVPFARPFNKAQFDSYCFEGVNDEDGPLQTDHVNFTSAASLGFTQSYGPAEVAYYLKPMEEKGREGLYYLMRREDGRPHKGLSEKGAVMEMAENVVSLSLSYLETPEREVLSWSLKERLKLPPQVKIVLTVRQGKEELPFTAIANLPLASGQLSEERTSQGLTPGGGDQSGADGQSSERNPQDASANQNEQTGAEAKRISREDSITAKGFNGLTDPGARTSERLVP